jgi:hypothetical protein
MKKYTGSCHCKAVKYEVEGDFTEGMSCNCSHCKRKGMMLAFVPEAQFKLLSGEDNLTTYHFNKHHIDHTFCKTCGVQSFARGHDGKGNVMVSINLNCLEDFDTDSINITKYDGASI